MTTRTSLLTLVGSVLLSAVVSFFIGRAAARCEMGGCGIASGAPDATVAKRGTGTLLPPSSPSAVAELKPWMEKEEVRRKWMFASEEVLLAHFGVPASVMGTDSGQEHWEYVTGAEEISLLLTRGRLTMVFVRALPKDKNDH